MSVDVVEIPYEPPIAGLPVEAFSLSSLLAREPLTQLENPQRIDFELLIWCRDGGGRHEVDFVEVELAAGTLLHVRPGQVHRWILEPSYDAELILLSALESRRSWEPGPQVVVLGDERQQDLDAALSLLSTADRERQLSNRSLHAVRELLVSLLDLDRTAMPVTSPREQIFVDFERLLGDAQSIPRTVDDAARHLGCSTRTLTRACQESAAASPKALLDQAVALEAQRRLSMGDSSVRNVAESLGFIELSHFSRFFARVAGESPSTFAARFA